MTKNLFNKNNIYIQNQQYLHITYLHIDQKNKKTTKV